MAREQRERLESIEAELDDVKRRLGRVWQALETTNLDMADASLSASRSSGTAKKRLEKSADQSARPVLSERREPCWIAPIPSRPSPTDMSEYLRTSELTETRVLHPVVHQGDSDQARAKASIIYTIPMPEDSPIRQSRCRRTRPDRWCSQYHARLSGAEGSRTPDLFNAIEALSQLSYSPT